MIPVVIAFTPNYIVQAATLIHSVLESSEREFEFICLVSDSIPQNQWESLADLTNGRGSLRSVQIGKLPDGIYTDPRYTAAAQFRLLLPELLPELDKVIYLDCDIVVRQDLSKLFNYDLGTNLLGAVFEKKDYLNSGVLLMNLGQMRKEHTSAKLIDALKTDYLEFPDQDALNMVCKDRILGLLPIWNCIRTFLLPQLKDDFMKVYDEKAYESLAIANIHYTGGKPWNIFSVAFEVWWKEYYSIPEPIRNYGKPSLKMRALARIYLTTVGKTIIDFARNSFRTLKYSK